MDFFNTLTLDLKVLVVAIAGFVLLAVFAGNRSTEKRYMFVLALLAAVGVYRFTHLPAAPQTAMEDESSPATQFVKAPDSHVPLVSTSAK